MALLFWIIFLVAHPSEWKFKSHALGYCAWHDSSISWRYFSVEICWGSTRAYVPAKIAQYTETRATCIFLFFLLKFKKVNFKLCFDLVFWWYQLLLHRVFEFSNALTPEAISNPNVPSSSGSRDCRSPVERPWKKNIRFHYGATSRK